MNETASLPRMSPLGATRKNEEPPALGAGIEPTAPVSQNSMPLAAASFAAGSEIVVP